MYSYYWHRSSTLPGHFDIRPNTHAGDVGPACDIVRTSSAAQHACHMLNAGICRIDPNATLGCRVIPTTNAWREMAGSYHAPAAA